MDRSYTHIYIHINTSMYTYIIHCYANKNLVQNQPTHLQKQKYNISLRITKISG